MIRINLLPHREEKRKARRQQFYGLAGLVVVLAGLIVFLGYTVINGYISAQEEKNAFLKQEISALDKQISAIKTLQEKIRLLLSRKQVIEDLQRDRSEPVNLLNELVRQLPEGVYIKTMRQDATRVSLNGIAQSNARVSALMRNFEASPFLERPVLIETKAVTVDKKSFQEFSMTVGLVRAKPETPKPGAPAGAKKS